MDHVENFTPSKVKRKRIGAAIRPVNNLQTEGEKPVQSQKRGLIGNPRINPKEVRIGRELPKYRVLFNMKSLGGNKGQNLPHNSIDYPETYKHIAMNMHVIQPMAEPLAERSSVYTSQLCRSTFLILIIRLAVIQLIIVSTQTIVVFAICILLLLELTRLSISTSLYIRKRHYKHMQSSSSEMEESLHT